MFIVFPCLLSSQSKIQTQTTPSSLSLSPPLRLWLLYSLHFILTPSSHCVPSISLPLSCNPLALFSWTMFITYGEWTTGICSVFIVQHSEVSWRRKGGPFPALIKTRGTFKDIPFLYTFVCLETICTKQWQWFFIISDKHPQKDYAGPEQHI